ncbi:hypothetical protein CHS0354_015577, partial [Potamilus streckersoni]
MHLAVSLSRQAQIVIGNLKDSENCERLSKAFEERFSLPNQTELYRAQIKERRQRTGETRPE